MAAVVSLACFHPSSHIFGFPTSPQHPHRPRGSAEPVARHNPFGAFSPRHHSSAKSLSTAASWRHSETVGRVTVPTRTSSPKYYRGGLTHYSSGNSNDSWRSHSSSTVATIVRHPMAQQPDKPNLKVSPPLVYPVAELLRLSASPLVGVSAESQLILDNLVAHHVWRRGPQSGTPKPVSHRHNSRTSKLRSLHSSTDDSDRN
ncbi:hypothetical protein BJV78DRAFT_1240733, partial [Lactifluus subvellereus]